MNSDAVKTIKYNGCRIKILRDENPTSSREWDNVGKIFFDHRQFYVKEINPEMVDHADYIIIPLYAYIHSGVALKIGAADWSVDRNAVFVEKKQAIEEFGREGAKKLTKKIIKKTYDCVKAEIKMLQQELDGDVYGYLATYTDKDGNETRIGSCWGYYGDDFTYIIDESKRTIDHFISKKMPLLAAMEA